MKKGKINHPGQVLKNQFLRPLGVSGYKLATAVSIPQTRVSEIIRGNRRITADTALRLSRYFNNDPKFWMNLQDEYDLETESKKMKGILKTIKPLSKKKK